MRLVTAGNAKFSNFIRESVEIANNLNYPYQVYDLGGLGFGKQSVVENKTFQIHGYYSTLSTWKTKALHKPDIILDALDENLIVYLDGDARVVQNIDELEKIPYDLGVTVRKKGELEQEILPHHRKIMGQINAGVMFIRSSAKPFLEKWKEKTKELQNDQFALNALLNPSGKHLKEEFIIDGLKIKTFPTEIYNFYYFPENKEKAKILHYKNDLWQNERKL